MKYQTIRYLTTKRFIKNYSRQEMKYKSNIEFVHPLAEIIKIDDLEKICRKYGINHRRLLNKIKGEQDRSKYKDWDKLMKIKPGFDEGFSGGIDEK